MLLKWCGQACFLLTFNNGIRIITDPFNKHLGYAVPRYEVEAITVSHNHYDHNYVRAVPNYQSIPILREPGEYNVGEVKIRGVRSFHDAKQGAERGKNNIFLFSLDNLLVAHLGDLGHLFNYEQLTEIGQVDILLLPIGGTYTVGAREAEQIVEQTKPSLVIPMHYKTDTLRYNLDPLEPFVAGKKNVRIIKSDTIELQKENLPRKTEILVLDNFSS